MLSDRCVSVLSACLSGVRVFCGMRVKPTILPPSPIDGSPKASKPNPNPNPNPKAVVTCAIYCMQLLHAISHM